MNLVEIRSHDAPKPMETNLKVPPESGEATVCLAEESKAVNHHNLAEEAKGFALTIKESFVESILEICEQVRPKSFLQAPADERPFVCQGDPD